MSYVKPKLPHSERFRLSLLVALLLGGLSATAFAQESSANIDTSPETEATEEGGEDAGAESDESEPQAESESPAEANGESTSPAEEAAAIPAESLPEATTIDGFQDIESSADILPIEEAATEAVPSVEADEAETLGQDEDEDGEQDEDEDEENDAQRHRFVFGSYGRLVAASDLRGSLGRSSNVVAFGPRVDEDVYAEIELRREDQITDEISSSVVATLALSGPLFHLDGEFDEQLAVRNLYAQIRGALVPGLSLWAGSRMVRGDDVYLLNFWPLDNLNIIGGGASYQWEDKLHVRLHVGLNRPRDPFFYQTRDVVATRGFDPENVTFLNRPRVVTALRATAYPIGTNQDFGLKAVFYGELHQLSSGDRAREDGTIENLPSDSGYMVGAQLGLWANRNADGYTQRNFLNVFFRYSRGLAAFDTFDAPFRTGTVVESGNASELMLALSGNFEYGPLGIQVGAYYRRFRDADPNGFESGTLREGAFSIRPHVFFGDYAGLSADLSIQSMSTSELDPRTGERVGGSIFKAALIPFVSLGGRGTYARPHLRLIYSLSRRNDAARRLYPSADTRSSQTLEHFLGIGAEWWFDSTSYR